MLHIDKGTGKYLFELDNQFKTANPLMSLGIRKEITKVFSDIQVDWDKEYKRVELGMSHFENKLLKALNDPIPHRYVGRPRQILRKFPYRNSGQLHDSYYQTVNKIDGDNEMTIKVSANFVSHHAEMTNDGWNSWKPGGRKPHWIHWYDKIFGDNREATIDVRHAVAVPNIRAVLIGYYS